MNFLAHLFLAAPNPELMVGNFIADHVKGNKWNTFEPAIAKGIVMHRAIDTFTDEHPLTAKSRQLLHANYGKWSGVVVDIFNDYFLAKDWNKYSAVDLMDFTQQAYNVLETHTEILPEKSRHQLLYMKRDNWLYHYQSTTGISFALKGLSQRRALNSGIETAVADLLKFENQFQQNFDLFMPQLMAAMQAYNPALINRI